MSKPRHTLYRRCEYEGCGDTGIVECFTAKERLAELRKPYRCAKHAEPSRLLTAQEEIGRLQAECDGAGRVIASLIVERDEAKLDAEHAKRLWVRWEREDEPPLTQGAVNAIHAEWQMYRDERDKLREEKAKLRAALERVASEEKPDVCADCSDLYPDDETRWC